MLVKQHTMAEFAGPPIKRLVRSNICCLLCYPQMELSCREQLVLEAEAVLAEADRRIAGLAAWASQHTVSTQQQPTMQTPQHMSAPGNIAGSQGAAAGGRRLAPSSSLGSRPGTSLSSSSRTAGPATAAAGSVQQVCSLVLEHCKSLLGWCRESQSRIAR